MPWEPQNSGRREEAHSKLREQDQGPVASPAAKWGGLIALLLLIVGTVWWLAHRFGYAPKQNADSPVAANSPATSALMKWKADSDVSALAGKPIRLRFVMTDAGLYLIRFRD